MDTFLRSVCNELIRRFGWEGLKDLTLVFPMHRASIVMRSELQRRMAMEHPAALWAPEMMALGDLFDSLCPLGKEDELFAVCRLHRIYCDCLQDDPMPIDRFYGWGRQLLSDFTNIDQGLEQKELESFFRNALTLADLDTYKLDDEVRQRLEDLLYKGEARTQSLIAQSVQAHFAALWKALPDIYHRLHEELLQAGKGYEGMRMRYVVSHWQELRSRATSKTYCFIGFNYLLPVEKQLMQLLHDEGRALFFWDYIEDFRTNSKAFAFIRKNMLTLPSALPAASWGQPRHVRTVSAIATHSEAEFAGQWMKQAYTAKGEQTAVIICDEGQLEPVIYSLPPIRLDGEEQPEDINITKGYPLRNTPIFAQVVKKLSAVSNQQSAVSGQLAAVLAYVDELSDQSKSEQQNTWQWHMQREALYQTRRTLVQFITILQDGLLSSIVEHPDLLRRLIIRHLEQITLPFHGEPVTDLQIMGVLETRTLDFKHLLLLNVEEGVIPAHQPDKSFLPYYLRKAYGLQTHDERASVYAYNFFRLLNRAEDVTILFSQSQTVMTKKTLSRFVMQMLVCPEEFTVSKFTLTESNTLQPAASIEIPADACWAQKAGTNNDSQEENKQLYLSPSALNTFYACKRKFYIEYMLGLREEDEQEVIFSNRTLGLFVHEAVHYLYEHYCHCDNRHAVSISPNLLESLNKPDKRAEALLAAYSSLNETYKRKYERNTPFFIYEQHALENRVIDKYVEHVLARDRYDAEHSGLTILLLESAQYTTVTVPMQNADDTVQVTIGGRIDRLDYLGGRNGLSRVVRIVDYKCGKYNEKKMNANEADLRTPGKADTDYVRQTLLYSYVAYNQPSLLQKLNCSPADLAIEPHLYFTSKELTGDVCTRVSVNKIPVVYNADTHQQMAELVRDILHDVVSEHQFPQCNECPEYCPFLQLCGRKPAR